jgi:hypothetical protein
MLGGADTALPSSSGNNNLMANDMMDLFGGAPAQTNT